MIIVSRTTSATTRTALTWLGLCSEAPNFKQYLVKAKWGQNGAQKSECETEGVELVRSGVAPENCNVDSASTQRDAHRGCDH